LLEQFKLNDTSGERQVERPCSMKQFRHLVLIFLLISQARAGDQRSVSQPTEPETFFREFVGLNDEQIRDVRSGKAIAIVLPSPVPDEVFVFGTVYINSTPEQYLKLASDVDALRKVPSFLALRKFSDPPRPADLDGFSFEDEDLKDIQRCQPGHCEVQLPAETMEEFQRSVDWSAPDHADKANRLAQRMVLDALQRYQQGGNSALGTYRDKNHPTQVAETFASLLHEIKALPAYLPELEQYLLKYPDAASDQIKSDFYWEKVNFGLKPTLRVVQVITYNGTSPDKPAYAVAVKQLYASHYFQTALDGTVCAKDASGSGFYLITIKGSRQAGLTGFKGGIVRKVAIDKTRSSLEKALASYKQQLEAKRE
jgi:hypothetical protein